MCRKEKRYPFLSYGNILEQGWLISSRFHIIIPSVYELKEEVQQLALKLNDLGSPTVFSHNDLLLNNIVYDEKKGNLSYGTHFTCY